MKSPHSQPNPAWTIVLTACLQSFILSAVPGLQAYAATGMSAPVQPFDDPTWKALIGLALLVNACLYALVWRKRAQ